MVKPYCEDCGKHRETLTPRVQAIVQRLESANEFIAEIAHRGRRFFEYVHDTDDLTVVRCEVAKFRRDENGKLWFWNEWRCKWIYVSKYGAWRGFHHGGTLHSLVGQLVEYIKTGKQLRGGWFDGKHWGYGDEMEIVVETGKRLGVIQSA